MVRNIKIYVPWFENSFSKIQSDKLEKKKKKKKEAEE